ncbi:hypothetical protein [Aeoliella sp. SH292]|uniref:hypothetical protein n=1 Tax=Aeoliella sp. SH292 TaxID=3454464 RepID=UPI003F961A19
MTNESVRFTDEQRLVVEQQLPEICERGGWAYRIAAAEIDHVHVLCDVDSDIHGEKVRRLLKRWLGQELSKHWQLDKGASWWAEEGSNRVVKGERYLANVYNYILQQQHSRAQ